MSASGSPPTGTVLGVQALEKLRKSHLSLSPTSAFRYSFLPFRVLPVTVSCGTSQPQKASFATWSYDHNVKTRTAKEL